MKEDTINPIIDKYFLSYALKKSVSYCEKLIAKINKNILIDGMYEPVRGQITVLDLLDEDKRLNYKTVMYHYRNYEKDNIECLLKEIHYLKQKMPLADTSGHT